MINKNFNPRSHIGETHGVYTIVDMLEEKDKYGHYIYVAECNECGFKKHAHYGAISGKSHIVDTCRHMLGNQFVKIDKWNNQRLSHIFHGMKKRCYNKNDKAYKWYGAKGIKICDEWLNNPKSFEDWALSNGYKDNLTIDRINEDKDYSPDNCEWITNVNNAKYKSTTSLIIVDNEKYTGREWAKVLGLGTNIINKYVKKYGIENTIEFIKRYRQNSDLKPQKKNQCYYEIYMK